MISRISYNNELDDFYREEFNVKLDSIDEDKNYFDRTIHKNNNIKNYIYGIKDKSENSLALIIKNFGTSEKKFILLNFLLAKKIYFSKRLNNHLDKIKIKIGATNLSEEIDSGVFHTDFSFQKDIPDYIAFQCIKPDPKYPSLGRNYIVSVVSIFDTLLDNFNLTEKYLLTVSLPYTFKNNKDETIWLNPFYINDSKISMKFHAKYIDTSKLKKEHYIGDISLVEIIGSIALSLSSEIVLDKGDVLIFSNKFALHKRGECSIDLINDTSRELNTMRFFV